MARRSNEWSDYNAELLKRLFTNGSLADEYTHHFGISVLGGPPPTLTEEVDKVHGQIQTDIDRLQSIMERLELIPEAVSVAAVPQPRQVARASGRRIFVVHGHDEAARESVARFLEKLGLDAIILHEQASGGRTLIEKLEHHSDVEFAVVLLTPDDVGAQASSQDKFSHRARQNVVLELGFFVGRLGRSRVCALHKGDIELPSDILGVGYVSMDGAGGWQMSLARELREAGFEVDLNAAI